VAVQTHPFKGVCCLHDSECTICTEFARFLMPCPPCTYRLSVHRANELFANLHETLARLLHGFCTVFAAAVEGTPIRCAAITYATLPPFFAPERPKSDLSAGQQKMAVGRQSQATARRGSRNAIEGRGWPLARIACDMPQSAPEASRGATGNGFGHAPAHGIRI